MNKPIDWIKQRQVVAFLVTALNTLEKLVLLTTLLSIAACEGQVSLRNTPARSGPIIITNGTVVDGRGSEPIQDGIVVIAGDRITFVGRAVIDLHERSADFIKVYLQREEGGVEYPMLTEEQLVAIVDEAHSLGMLVRAHVSYASLLDMAVQARVDILEHVPANATQSEAQSISESQWKTLLESDDPLRVYFTELYPQYESQLERMVEAGIVMVPTLDSYMNIYQDSTPTPQDKAGIKLVLGIVRRFHELRGALGLGTDFIIDKGKQAGMPLREMEMLLAAGLTPMEVIEAGTRQAANVCGHGGELGTLAPGMLADVIVVDGDPLEDLQAMSRVSMVIKNGEIAVIFPPLSFTRQAHEH